MILLMVFYLELLWRGEVLLVVMWWFVFKRVDCGNELVIIEEILGKIQRVPRKNVNDVKLLGIVFKIDVLLREI